MAEAENAHLKTALVSARRNGAAIGILMARRSLTDDAVFDILKQSSMDRQQKLRDVVETVLYTGDLPPSGRS